MEELLRAAAPARRLLRRCWRAFTGGGGARPPREMQLREVAPGKRAARILLHCALQDALRLGLLAGLEEEVAQVCEHDGAAAAELDGSAEEGLGGAVHAADVAVLCKLSEKIDAVWVLSQL